MQKFAYLNVIIFATIIGSLSCGRPDDARRQGVAIPKLEASKVTSSIEWDAIKERWVYSIKNGTSEHIHLNESKSLGVLPYEVRTLDGGLAPRTELGRRTVFDLLMSGAGSATLGDIPPGGQHAIPLSLGLLFVLVPEQRYKVYITLTEGPNKGPAIPPAFAVIAYKPE